MIERTRITYAIQAADRAFWGIIARRFPEALFAVDELDRAAVESLRAAQRVAVEDWLVKHGFTIEP